MTYSKTDYGYLVILARGEQVMNSLQQFATQENIQHASLSGLGAVENSECCYYDLSNKEYICKSFPETYEVLALTGNIAHVDGAPIIHAHIVLGDKEMHTYGGHLKEATVAVTLEVMINTSAQQINRIQNDEIGLKLIEL